MRVLLPWKTQSSRDVESNQDYIEVGEEQVIESAIGSITASCTATNTITSTPTAVDTETLNNTRNPVDPNLDQVTSSIPGTVAPKPFAESVLEVSPEEGLIATRDVHPLTRKVPEDNTSGLYRKKRPRVHSNELVRTSTTTGRNSSSASSSFTAVTAATNSMILESHLRRGEDSDTEAREDPAWDEPIENDPPSLSNASTIIIQPSSSFMFLDEGEEQEESQPNVEPSMKKRPSWPYSFGQDLKKRGLEIVEQEGDGNCLFRAISLQVYGDSAMHGEVRERCLDYMERNPEHFAPFITLDEEVPGQSPTSDAFAKYIARKRHLGVHGNNPEIQAASELYNRPVEVFTPEQGATPLNIFQSAYKTTDVPIRLSYHDGNHYNAVIDPLVPTAGLGLGLPGLQPGLADKMQLAKAVAESDYLADEMDFKQAIKMSREEELKRAVKENPSLIDKMYGTAGLSDVEATNFELEQKVLASSLESYRRQEHGRKQRASPSQSRRKQPLSVAADDSHDFGNAIACAGVSGPAVAPAAASVATIAPAFASIDQAATIGSADEYPPTVQELVMNGFELRKVVHAYELIGDNFDDLLAFLIANNIS